MANDLVLIFQSVGVGASVLVLLGACCLIEIRVRAHLSSTSRTRTNISRAGRFA